MASLNFPDPADSQEYISPTGVIYTWDGEKWSATGRDGLNIDADGNVTIDHNLVIGGDLTVAGEINGQGGGVTVPPVINTVTLSELNPYDARFTSQSFKAVYDMLNDGQPASTKGLKGKVTAEFNSYAESGAVSNPTKTDNPANIQNTGQQAGEWGTTGAGLAIWQQYVPASHKMRYFGFKRDQYYTYVYEWDDEQTRTITYQSQYNQGGSDGWIFAFPTKDRKIVNLGGYGWTGTGLDMEKFLEEGTVQVTGQKAYTNNYYYTFGSGYLYRYQKDGTNIGYQYFDTNYCGYGKGCIFELGDSTIGLIMTPQSGTGTTYLHLVQDSVPDSAFNNTNSYPNSSLPANNPTSAFVYQGKFYANWSQTMYVVSPDGSQTSQPIPKNGYITVDECNNIFYLNYISYYSQNVQEIGVYTSNNYGVTWNKFASQTNSQSNVNTGYTGKAWWTTRSLVFKAQPEYQAANYYARAAGYYQNVTVATDSLDKTAVLINSPVIPSSYTGAEGWGTGTVTAINDQGDGTTILQIAGGATYSVGDTVNLAAPTGIATSTRYLVLDIAGNVSATVANDPGFVDVGTGLEKNITFPATFSTGKAPDEELPAGTIFQVEARAKNTNAETVTVSNAITPGNDPAPPPPLACDLSAKVFTGTAPEMLGFYSDNGADISGTLDADIGAVWKSQEYWKNKSNGWRGTKKGFFWDPAGSSATSGGADGTIKLTFQGSNLKNKILKIHCYTKTSDGGSNQITASSETAGVDIATVGNTGQVGQWSYTNVDNTYYSIDMQFNITEDITEFTVKFIMNGYIPNVAASPQTEYWVNFPWFRVTDLSGNELTFYP